MRSSIVSSCVLLGLISTAFACLGGAAAAADDVTCADALKTLMPCIPFLTGVTPSPIAPCCIGVSALKGKADTTEIRRSLCRCLKEAAPKLGVIPEKAKQIPVLCRVELPAPVDPDVDCSKYLPDPMNEKRPEHDELSRGSDFV